VYQLEVKLGLVRHAFQPASGWRVTVDVDPMERAGHHPDKSARATKAMGELRALGATLGPHNLFGRVDVVAEHDERGLRLVEVTGESGRQREQGLYSCLGQLILSMKLWNDTVRYGIATPDTREWVRQLRKIPVEVAKKLNLELYLIAAHGVTIVEPGISLPNWERG
jgi:hypothetical protein